MITSILKSAGIIVGSLALAYYFLSRLLAIYRQAAAGPRPFAMKLSKAINAITFCTTLVVVLFIMTGGTMSLVGELSYNLKGRPLTEVLHTINSAAY